MQSKVAMLELELVALYRPGWLVPNSADTVKAKALHQERNLCGSYLSKFPSLLPYQQRLMGVVAHFVIVPIVAEHVRVK